MGRSSDRLGAVEGAPPAIEPYVKLALVMYRFAPSLFACAVGFGPGPTGRLRPSSICWLLRNGISQNVFRDGHDRSSLRRRPITVRPRRAIC